MAGLAAKKSLLTTSSVVENRPLGHKVFSFTRTCPWPSATSRVAQGSGTQAPAIEPASKEVSVVALSSGRMVTWPLPPLGPGKVRPCFLSQVRKATSWVLPSCGVAMVLPLSWLAEVIDGETTSAAPPEVAPEMIRMAPRPCEYAVMAELGPM